MSSQVPKGDQQVDMGSSMLLPGFSFEDNYNEGVLEGARLPSVPGFSQLPTHIMTSEASTSLPEVSFRDAFYTADGMDLPVEMGKSASNLVDLSWMDAGTFQVTDREPMLQQLERAWSARTDGVHRTEAHASPPLPTMREVAQTPDIIRLAMRRSARGVPFRKVAQEVLEAVGEEAFPKFAEALKFVQAEDGLHGRVYLRASAFGGVTRDQVRDYYPDARYMLACGTCLTCEGGMHSKCSAGKASGLEVVAKVPWREAYQHYMGRIDLQPFAQKSATAQGSIRDAFRARDSHVEETRVASEMPQIPCRMQDVEDVPAVKVKTAREVAQDAAEAFLVKWQARGKLTEPQVAQLRKMAHQDMYEAASALVMGVRTHAYQGDVISGVGGGLSSEEANARLKAYQRPEQPRVRSAGSIALLKAASASVQAGVDPQELQMRLSGFLPETVNEVYSELEVLFKEARANEAQRPAPLQDPVQNPVANYSNTMHLATPSLGVTVGSAPEQGLDVFGLANGLILD